MKCIALTVAVGALILSSCAGGPNNTPTSSAPASTASPVVVTAPGSTAFLHHVRRNGILSGDDAALIGQGHGLCDISRGATSRAQYLRWAASVTGGDYATQTATTKQWFGLALKDLCPQQASRWGSTAIPDPGPRGPSRLEVRAFTRAYGPHARPSDLRFLRGICRTTGRNSLAYLHRGGSRSQIREIKGAMKLCPHWSLRRLALRYIDEARSR